MLIGHGHALQLHDATATLVLSGKVTTRDVTAIRRECRAIPDRIQTLRLDVIGVPEVEGNALQAVRAVVRAWTRARTGDRHFELRSALLVARVEHHHRVSTPA